MSDEPPIADRLNRLAADCIAIRVRLINRVISGFYDDALRPHGLRIGQAS